MADHNVETSPQAYARIGGVEHHSNTGAGVDATDDTRIESTRIGPGNS